MPQTESLVAVQPEIEPNSDYSITMVGHSTFLVKMAGVNILTDPVSTSQLFPYAPFGYGKRISPAGLNLYETPVKVVVLSHSDPDHFEPRILKAIAQKGKTIAVCHQPLAGRLEKLGFTVVESLAENQSTQIGEITITAVHAEHRGQNKAVGFIFQHQGKSVYFAGDTGDFQDIEAIAKTYKPDIAILPIGEYPPLPLAVAKYFISKGFNIPQVLIDKLKKLEEIKRKKVHMSPEDVLLLSKHFHQIVVMHHGTYFLGGHIDPNEPADLMRRLIEENQLGDKITILAPGQSLSF